MATVKLLLLLAFIAIVSAASLKSDSKVPVFHATNVTQVPSPIYIVEAVESLRQAYGVYATDKQRAELYALLYQQKHPQQKWNVIVGYTDFYVQTKIYVECDQTGGEKKVSLKDDKKGSKKWLIFSEP